MEIPFESIQNSDVREGFRIVNESWAKEPMVNSGFRHFQIEFNGTGTFLINHGLGFKPFDLLQSFLTGSGTVTWNYITFDNTNLSVTIGGTVSKTVPTVVRFFVGSYQEL